jgi:hypothetical protein
MRATSRCTAAAAFLLVLATAPLAHGAAQCYFPSGNESSDVPCDPNAEVSMCCPTQSDCLSSGLCLNSGTGSNQGISFARGTCTDQSWDSPFCPQNCRISMSASQPIGVGVERYQVLITVGFSLYRPGRSYQANGVRLWKRRRAGVGVRRARICRSRSLLLRVSG